MLKEVLKNYRTANDDKLASEKDWCISPFPGKIQQAKLKLGRNKAYDYACRYPVSEGDVAIVGYSLPVYDYHTSATESSSNTGRFGSVAEVLPKLTIKRDHAVEVDYVFTPKTEKKNVTQCLKYLQSGEDAYENTIQLGKHVCVIRPITYYIRQILAAASVLAHPKFTNADGLDLAREKILEEKIINDNMRYLEHSPGGDIGFDFSDVQIPDPELEDKLSSFSELAEKPYLFEEGCLDVANDCLSVFLSSDMVIEHVKKYPHFGAVSVMIRGGFKNLLAAYLSVNPPIDGFYDEMCRKLEGVGHKEVYNLLAAYKG